MVRGAAAAFLLLFPLLSGCAQLPADGPTALNIESASKIDNYELIDIDPDVLRVLSKKPSSSLKWRFGDYRPPSRFRIGVGDSVVVTIWETGTSGLFASTTATIPGGSRAATLPEQVVANDGTITMPFAGRIKAAGLTPAEVQKAIVERLESKSMTPQALVTVSKSVSNTVTVTGDVTSGGRIPLSVKGDRIIDGIAMAGGLRSAVDDTVVMLTRGNTTVSVPYSKIVAKPEENIYLRAGDVITVVKRPQTFTAFGATGRNAEIPFESYSINLAIAMARAGGLLDNRADPASVFVFRWEPADIVREMRPTSQIAETNGLVPVIYRLNLREASGYFYAQGFEMQRGDLLYVSNAPLADLQKFLQIISSATAPAIQGATIYRITN